jgi:hypothetical protein
LGVLAEADLAQEAGVRQREGVVALVEEMVGTVESLIEFVSTDVYGPTDVGHLRCSQKKKGHGAPPAGYGQP